jgi:epoxyqueuosine reductase
VVVSVDFIGDGKDAASQWYDESPTNSSDQMGLDAHALTTRITEHGRELGFDLTGVALAEPSARAEFFRRWLEEGRAGSMSYLYRTAGKRCDPRSLLKEARSVICVAQSYRAAPLPEPVKKDPSRGLIASYAWGRDYHETVGDRLEMLARFVNGLASGTRSRWYVDTGPLFEKEFGERAGLGFIGKNTLLISPAIGSMLFLGEVLTTLELTTSAPSRMPSCGTCTACLQACPTGALTSAYTIDAARCISYLTIEHEGIIPRELRQGIGNHMFGCDECQDCCPWNNSITARNEGLVLSTVESQAPKLAALATLTEEEFKQRFGRTSVARTGLICLLRNVAVALGNWGTMAALDSLLHLLKHSASLVRLHAAWAVGQVRDPAAGHVLKTLLDHERDETVRQEAARALEHHQSQT